LLRQSAYYQSPYSGPGADLRRGGDTLKLRLSPKTSAVRKILYLFAATLLLTQVALSSAEMPDKIDMSGSGRPDILKGVTIEQRLNSQIPLDATFRDENGQTVQLAKYFGKRPVVLALVYYECPMLCTQILNGVVRTAKSMTLVPGKDYDVVVISFDPKETPAMATAKKATYMKNFGHPETAGGWHFLTGATPSIDRVTDAVGFRYKWDPSLAAYAHASAVYVLTPEGRLSKYFYGINYSATDMRFGLVEASHDKIGTAVDQLLLFCCQFDPGSGKYTLAIYGVLRLVGAATLLLLGGYVTIMLRRDKAKKNQTA
jgi:protein SCO1/2